MTGGQEEKCIENEKTNRESLVRPKTRLVRPTPNIKHPVITSADWKNKNSATGAPEKGPGANNTQSKSVTANDSTDNNKSEDQVRSTGAKKCNVKGASDGGKDAPVKGTSSTLSSSIGTSTTSSTSTCTSSCSSHSQSHGKEDGRREKRQRESQRNASKRQEPQQVGASCSGQREGVKKNRQSTSSCTSSSDICHSRTWERFKSSLKTCSKCQRQFFAYRITHHLQLCSGQMDAKPGKEASKGGQEDVRKAMPTPSQCPPVLATSCSSSSPLPSTSPGVETSLQNIQLEMSEEEMAQWQEHLKKLKKCKICTRSFFPERLGTHQAICAQKTLDQSHPCRRLGKKEP